MTLEEFRHTTKGGGWRVSAQALICETNHSLETIRQFSTYWIEAGHHIREQISDDKILVTLLRHLLPAYEGEPLKLYRGENQGRWDEGRIGLAWTENIDIARMFARGLNSTPKGGLILKGEFKQEAIISGPNLHSKYLGEEQFTIDPFYKADILVIEKFVPY